MRLWKDSALFSVGGCAYVALETLWRGWSHGSMFLAGGSCFLLLGKMHQKAKRLPLPIKAAAGAGIITSVELLTGLIANRNYQVWDYRDVPMNFQGQICLPFTLLWAPLSVVAMGLYDRLDRLLQEQPR